VVTAVTLGAGLGEAATAVGSFPGVKRRLSIAGEVDGVMVLDSFAHHPTAIRADLTAARALTGPGGAVRVVYEPTGAGRVAVHGRAMGSALRDGADYAAVLQPRTGVSGEAADAATLGGPGVSLALTERVLDNLAADARPGDVVVLMGTSPRIAAMADAVLDGLQRRPQLALS